jgi:hypothetical protein
MLAEVVGQTVANENVGETAKVEPGILRNCLTGSNGRTKVEGWVPRWMVFPPSSYTDRRCVGTVARAAQVASLTAPDPSGEGRGHRRDRRAGGASAGPSRLIVSPAARPSVAGHCHPRTAAMSETPDPVDLARLERAIADLPHLQREVFLARRVDGLSCSHIACWKNLSRRMVKKLMARAPIMIDLKVVPVNPYDPVLSDLRSKRDAIDDAIQTLEGLRDGQLGISPAMTASPARAPEPEGAAGMFLGMSIAEAAIKLLKMRKRSMGNAKILKELQAGGLVLTSAEPMNVIRSVLTRRFNNVGDIVRVSRGVWGLKEWYPGRASHRRVAYLEGCRFPTFR